MTGGRNRFRVMHFNCDDTAKQSLGEPTPHGYAGPFSSRYAVSPTSPTTCDITGCLRTSVRRQLVFLFVLPQRRMQPKSRTQKECCHWSILRCSVRSVFSSAYLSGSLLEVALATRMQQHLVPSVAIREWSSNRLRMDRVLCDSPDLG